jgi:transcriptional regulator with XRE-family HTH domain
MDKTYSLAQRLRVARAYRGWSQTKLSKRSGVHNMQISKLERGVTKEISGSTLRALCESLGVSPSYILGMTEDMEAREPLAGRTDDPTPPPKRPRPRKAAPVG